MKCPWPALRVARAMRSHATVAIAADDPIAERELRALADQHGWTFAVGGEACYMLGRND